MFGLFKKIFKKEESAPSAIAPASPAAPAYSRTATPGQPARPAGNPFSSGEAAAVSTMATPAPPSTPATAPAPPVAPVASGSAVVQPKRNGSVEKIPTAVTLSLDEIVPGLTHEFQSLFEGKKNTEVSFPLQAILPQLSTGRIRVAFGELRNACPDGSCKAGPEHDGKLIDLPLAKVLSRVNPAFLPRKTQRAAMNVPEDVTGLFGSLGEPLPSVAPASKESVALSPAPRAAQPAPAPALPEQPIAAKLPKATAQQPPAIPKPNANQKKAITSDELGDIPSPFNFQQSAPAEEAAPAIVEPEAPEPLVQSTPEPEIASELEDIPAIKFSLGGSTPEPTAPVAEVTAPVEQPVIPMASAPKAATPVAPAPKPVATHNPVKAPKPAPVPAPPVATAPVAVPAPAAVAPDLDDHFIILPVAKAQDGWSDSVQAEIKQYNLGDAQFGLPYGEVDLAMRKGKIVFPWKTLRSWITPVGSAPKSTECDDEELVLPLKMVAPLFLKQRQPRGKQRKVSIEEEIPDLFSGAPEQEPEPAAAAPESTPAPASPAAPAPVVPEPAAAIPNVSASNPAELVKRTASMPGVTGALVAMSDGLVVASELPAPLVGETVAAFLPQIFGRLTQFSTELKLGNLTSVMLVMDNSPWIIFRTGKVYFAVVGKAGEALPLPQLTAIVADIKRQNL